MKQAGRQCKFMVHLDFLEIFYVVLYSLFSTSDAIEMISGHLFVTTDSLFRPLTCENFLEKPSPTHLLPETRTITSYYVASFLLKICM